ncbi:MAG: hypothetical protein L0Y58_02330 [Verrucomicrobia subdivision 3 bacterium]|nr:hypothetical protein [Limisphaerales bacterium]
MVSEKIILCGLRIGGGDERPTIAQRTDQEFIPAILEELRTGGEALTRIGASAISPRPAGSPALKLFQPVQRTFNVALLDAVCDRFSSPRLDPERIESAGLVVRRLSVDLSGNATGGLQGWMQSGARLRGWLALGVAGQSRSWLEFDPDADPDPLRRQPALTAGHPEIDRQLKLLYGAEEVYSESVSPLFVAPPEVCQAVRRTILYGLIPVTSSERSDAGQGGGAQAARETPYDLDELERALPAHLPDFLQREGPARPPGVPRAGQFVTKADAEVNVATFTLSLRQLKIEFDAFGDRGDGGTLFDQLNRIVLDELEGLGERRFGQFLKDAVGVLVDGAGGSLLMPERWPKISANQERGFVQSAKAVLQKRLDEFTGGEGRFDDVRPNSPRRYVLRAFVRVRSDEGCPPKLVWSEYSEQFTIAPWYEGGLAPPAQVNLPNALDKNLLRSLKPNIAFVVPTSLANVLNGNSPKSFIEGEAGEGDGNIDFDWICSFSIPLITLCAFIVLNIFLQLFNLIFQWLQFIKICIPFPRRK